jgi:hypothetical protein
MRLLTSTAFSTLLLAAAGSAHAQLDSGHVADSIIDAQHQALAENTRGQGFGPQSPRDLENPAGSNLRVFSTAPAHTQMNLCNIHFHKNAEHRGGEFTTYAGNGDGHGYGSGFRYNGTLTAAQLAPTAGAICPSDHGPLVPGDTVEVHYVFSTAQAAPGATLGACLNPATGNPQLRVEGQVYVLANDRNALDFNELAAHGMRDGYHQALNIPDDTGEPIQYAGSTTGPAYNEQGSPLLVSWSVRPNVAIVDIETVGAWCGENAFEESGAHGVRNLVEHADLLSPIQ